LREPKLGMVEDTMRRRMVLKQNMMEKTNELDMGTSAWRSDGRGRQRNTWMATGSSRS